MVEARLSDRVLAKRLAERLSHRQLSRLVGVSFSTLARVERGDGEYGEESERRLREWLGDDVSHLTPHHLRAKAEELGRIMARACAAEIMQIIREGLSPSTQEEQSHDR